MTQLMHHPAPADSPAAPHGAGSGAAVAPIVPQAFVARVHWTLQTVEVAWRRLEEAGTYLPYQTYGWTEGVVRHLAAARRGKPFIVEVLDAVSDRTLMLLPLMLVSWRGCRVIEGLDCGVCDYAAPVLAAGFEVDQISAAPLWQAIRRRLPPADLMLVRHVPATINGADNPLLRLCKGRLSHTRSFGMPIEGDPQTLLKRVCRPSAAKEIAKDLRRLERIGPLCFVEARTEAQVRDIFAALIRQRLSRFGQTGRFDLLEDKGVQAFYLDAALAGARGKGPVRLFALSVGGEWIACQYGLLGREAFHALILTMAGEPWRKFSPGVAVVSQVMCWARTEGLSYFDLTIGDLPYKAGLGATPHELYDIDLAFTARGRLARAAKVAAASAGAWLRRRTWAYGRLRRIRQAMRRMRHSTQPKA